MEPTQFSLPVRSKKRDRSPSSEDGEASKRRRRGEEARDIDTAAAATTTTTITTTTTEAEPSAEPSTEVVGQLGQWGVERRIVFELLPFNELQDDGNGDEGEDDQDEDIIESDDDEEDEDEDDEEDEDEDEDDEDDDDNDEEEDDEDDYGAIYAQDPDLAAFVACVANRGQGHYTEEDAVKQAISFGNEEAIDYAITWDDAAGDAETIVDGRAVGNMGGYTVEEADVDAWMDETEDMYGGVDGDEDEDGDDAEATGPDEVDDAGDNVTDADNDDGNETGVDNRAAHNAHSFDEDYDDFRDEDDEDLDEADEGDNDDNAMVLDETTEDL